MREQLSTFNGTLRFFVGDVRDKDRLQRAFQGVDYVIHAAAMKQIPACEYNPNEAIKTNIIGAMNVIEAALNTGVSRVVALSTDKAVHPINLYGATKLASDKLFVAANAYSGFTDVCFSVVRYGNVAGSRGSVIPFFSDLIKSGEKKLPITDHRMTRFWISLEQGVDLVSKALGESKGGEIFISKIPSFKVTDLAQAMLPGCEIPEVGIRDGEKLHEVMIIREDSIRTYEYEKHYVIYPPTAQGYSDRILHGGTLVTPEFEYSSNKNTEWLSVDDLMKLVSQQFPTFG